MKKIDVLEEIEFILGDSILCNTPLVVSVLNKYGIDPDGGFLFIQQLPNEAIADLTAQLEECGYE